MKNVKPLQLILLILLSISLPLLEIITFEYKCDYLGDGGPDFFGFPFIYRTEIPWVNSLEGNFYIRGYLGNVVFYFVLLYALVFVERKLNLCRRCKKFKHRAAVLLSAIVVFFASIMFFLIDWEYKWSEKHLMNYGGNEIKCEKRIKFFEL